MLDRIFTIFLALISFALVYLTGYGETFDFDSADLRIVNVDGHSHRFALEVAVSRKQRARGLMFRQYLSEGRGMIFILPKPRIAKMWMKDTPLWLDMLFVDDRGVVQEVKPYRSPNSEAIISSSEKVRYIVELKGGASATFGIISGSKIELPQAIDSGINEN